MTHNGQPTVRGRGAMLRVEHAGNAEVTARGPIRVLRFRTVRDRTGLSRSTIWRLERRGVFPQHRRISINAVGWIEDEVEAWIRSRSVQ